MKTTDDLIQRLSSDMTPTEGKYFYATSFLWWMGGTLALLALSFHFLPFRQDLALRFRSVFFTGETLLVFALYAMTVVISYRSSIPGLLQSVDRQIGVILLVVLAVMLLSKLSFATLATEFPGEMDFYRGRCGPIMLVLGGLDTGLLMALARRGAPTKPRLTGLWIALSAGVMGLFVMQFICAHENFLHVLIWHLVPVAVMAMGGAALGRRLLKW